MAAKVERSKRVQNELENKRECAASATQSVWFLLIPNFFFMVISGVAAWFTDNSVERMHTYVLKHDDGNTGCVSSVLVRLRLAFEPFEFRLSVVAQRHQEKKKKEQEKKRKEESSARHIEIDGSSLSST